MVLDLGMRFSVSMRIAVFISLGQGLRFGEVWCGVMLDLGVQLSQGVRMSLDMGLGPGLRIGMGVKLDVGCEIWVWV